MTKFDKTSGGLYEQFARMLWKSSTKTAFGMIDRAGSDTVWVVGYYCYDKPVVADHYVTVGSTCKLIQKDTKTVAANVGRDCFTGGYNDCYNQRAVASHNEKRERHAGYVPLVLDTDIAKAIQAQLESPGFTGAVSSQDKGKYANCGENIFVLADQTKLSQVPLTDMASDFWYGGMQYWDIPAGAEKAGNKASQSAQAKNFAQMLWQGTTKVGFGVYDKYVVAWYCASKAELADAARAKTNVGAPCYGGGYNGCYNRLALKAANKVRNNHDVGALKLNEGAAREIDYHLSAQRPGEFLMPHPGARGWKYTGCYQSVFLQTAAALRPKVSSTSAAPEYWYDGVKSYDYARNAPKQVTSGFTEEPIACS